jgi:hypothetical protein
LRQQSKDVRRQAAAARERAEGLLGLAGSVAYRPRPRRDGARVTIAPIPAAPLLWCRSCRGLLVYLHTVLMDVDSPDRWDWFRCACGVQSYDYRVREWSWQDR